MNYFLLDFFSMNNIHIVLYVLLVIIIIKILFRIFHILLFYEFLLQSVKKK